MTEPTEVFQLPNPQLRPETQALLNSYSLYLWQPSGFNSSPWGECWQERSRHDTQLRRARKVSNTCHPGSCLHPLSSTPLSDPINSKASWQSESKIIQPRKQQCLCFPCLLICFFSLCSKMQIQWLKWYLLEAWNK